MALIPLNKVLSRQQVEIKKVLVRAIFSSEISPNLVRATRSVIERLFPLLKEQMSSKIAKKTSLELRWEAQLVN